MHRNDRSGGGVQLSPQRRIDAICDRFEVAWRAGESPRIEDYLDGWPEPERANLFWELLAVELELRRGIGEVPTPEEYRARFPEQSEVVDAATSGCSSDRQGDALTMLWTTPRQFLDLDEGGPEPTVLARIMAQGAARVRYQDLAVPPTRPARDLAVPGGVETTEWMPTTPDPDIRTEADLTYPPEDVTEEMPGSGERPAKHGAIIHLLPDTALECDFTGPPPRTDPDIRDRGPEGEERTDAGDSRLAPDRAPFGILPAVGARIPGYVLLEKLGEGGMGVVYKARQVALNRLVAVKMIRGGGGARPEHFARFRTEAETIARLRHPHILQIFDVGMVGDLPFLSLELLDGGSLNDRLAGTPQPGRDAAEFLALLARTIDAAHQVGIIHRDLKPTNILFTSNGIPKISDFGLAKRLESDSKQTETGQIMGSPSYMAPEQARGHAKDVGPAADIYALGAILYEMLTGRPPFKGETPMETVRQVIDDDPVPPSRLVPRVRRDLETICLKCLAKEPRKRYDSANEVADDLERFLNGEPIKARSAGWWERGAKWARRRPVAATLSMLSLAAILSLSGAGWWRAQQENTRVDRLRSEIAPSLSIGLDLLAQERWNDAILHLTKIHSRLIEEPQLSELEQQAEILLARARRGRADQEATETDRKKYEEFLRLRDEALIHDTRFTGLGRLGDVQQTRRAAREALAVFGTGNPADSWEPAPLPGSLSPRQRDEIREDSYVLLLVLAESTDRPEQGLRLLDQATRLRPPTRAYHLRRAALLVRMGDPAGAEKARREADRLPPATAFDHFLAGKERFERQQWSAAIQEFDAALQLKPDHFWAHALSAICSIQLGRSLPAKAELNACLQSQPGLPWLYVLRGFASLQIAVLARTAAENSATGGHTLRTEVQLQLADAEADYARALQLLQQTPNDGLRYAVLVNRGLLWLERRNWDRAVTDLQAAIGLDGRQYQAYETLAQVRRRQDRPDEAVELFSRAIVLRPDWAPLYRARGEAELARKDPTPAQRARALADLEQAIRLGAKQNPLLAANDHTNRGRLLHREDRDQEALAACEAALKLVSTHADAQRLRLDILLAQKRFDEVIGPCDALLAREKSSADLYELRGLARAGLMDYAGAIEDDTKALSLRPGCVPLLARRGALYLVTDAPRLALRDFEEAIGRDPAYGDAYIGRASALVRLGQHRQAEADVDKALRLGKRTSPMLYNAARVLSQAAAVAGSEVRRKGQVAVAQVNRYQDRAVELVQEALKLLPPDRRAAFLKEVLQDPDLGALRRRLRSVSPAGLSISPSGIRPKS
jgi:serine/threonine protein kinase/Tfp pilus assembly protein PilF